MSARRSYGAGSLLVRRGKWVGQWRAGGRQVARVLGSVREPGSSDGLTPSQAERELALLLAGQRPLPAKYALTVEQAGERYVQHVEHVMQRKASTVQDYRIMLERHLAPFFGTRPLDRIEADEAIAYMALKRREGLSSKTIANHLTFFNGVFRYAIKRRWAKVNPLDAVDRPRGGTADPDIRFLSVPEFEALLRKGIPDDELGAIDRTLYLTAAMTGIRQGELVALRWRDVDWTAERARVRKNRERDGRMGAPKSKRSSRSVPLATRVLRELELHFQRSAYRHDEDLVFCHPHTGKPYDPSKIRKRFKDALASADVRTVRFHDLRHTFGTQAAGAGAPLRTLQEWMGHKDSKTTEIYADYLPADRREAELVERAFAGERSPIGHQFEPTRPNSAPLKPRQQAESDSRQPARPGS